MSKDQGSGAEDAIGSAAVRFGWLTPDKLAQAREEHRPLGNVLVERGWLTADQLAYLRMVVSQVPTDATGAPRIGRYEVRGLLGIGAMGKVLRVYDPSLKRDVALKIPQGDALARWEREARAMARLNHPNIAAVYDVGEDAGVRYMAMELIDGRPLDQVWENWPLRRKVEALRDVAAGVAYAHAKGVVHRDLKPANVMVTSAGEIKVVDFGLAAVEGERSVTRTGSAVGTPYYMSPEQVRGEHAVAATDVWALGVMLYEGLTRHLPFGGRTVSEVYQSILYDEPMRPSQRNAAVPLDLDAICLATLEKDPDRRYPTAQAFEEDLRRWLGGEAIAARTSTLGARLVRRMRRNPWPWAAAAAAIILLAAGALGMRGLLRGRDADRLASEAAIAYAKGDVPAARERAEAALRIAPTHADARYWKARLLLREYQASRSVPEVMVSRGTVVAMPPAPETHAQQAMRREIRDALKGRAGEAHAEGVLAMWDGRYDDALAALGRAGTSDEAEVRLLSAQCLYFLQRFREAHDVLAPVPKERALLPTWTRLLIPRALEAELAGAPGDEWFRRAEEACIALKVAGDEEGSRVLGARVSVEWADAERKRGRDPKERIDRALALLEGLRGVEACVTRGDALLTRAEHLAMFGRLDVADPVEFRDAIGAYTQAVASRPDHALACLRRAAAARARHEYFAGFGRSSLEDVASALRDYARARELSADHPEAIMGVAWAEAVQMRADPADIAAEERSYEREIEVLSRVIQAHSRYVPARLRRGELRDMLANHRRSMGRDAVADANGALAEYSAVLKVKPDCVEALGARCGTYQVLAVIQPATAGESFRAAHADIKAALEANPNDPGMYERLSAVLRQEWRVMGDRGGPLPTEEAIEAANHAIQLRPNLANGYLARAYAYRDHGDARARRREDPLPEYEASLKDLEHALGLNPKLVDACRVSAMLHQRVGEIRAAAGKDPTEQYGLGLRDIERALSIDPSGAQRSGALMMARGILFICVGEYKASKGIDPTTSYGQAVNALTQAVAINAAYSDFYRLRARARFELGLWRAGRGEDPLDEYRQALADYDHIIERFPKDALKPRWEQERSALREAQAQWERRP